MTHTKRVAPGRAWATHAWVPVLFALILGVAGAPAPADQYRNRRLIMVRDQIEARGIKNTEVLAVMRSVPRELFVPESVRSQAYDDHPLPIGFGQTISQPFIVGLMT